MRVGPTRSSFRGGVLLLLLAAACGGGRRHRPAKLTLYCSVRLEWCEAAASEFERATGIRVSMTRKSSGESYAQIWAERRNPRGDVWFGGTGDAHIQAAEARLTEPYRSPRLPELHDWARDPAGRGENRATGIYMGVLAFGINREWIAKRQVRVPRSWSDLTSEVYRGEIQMANPNSSGTAYTMLATIVQLFGEQRGFEVLQKIGANVNQYTASGSAPVSAAARGETGIAISFLHDILTEKLAGSPLEIVVPSEGTGSEIGCVSIVRGARHPQNARRFVDWALSPRAQELGGRSHGYQWPSNPNGRTPSELPELARIRLVHLDLGKYGSKRMRSRLLSTWERRVHGGGQ